MMADGGKRLQAVGASGEWCWVGDLAGGERVKGSDDTI